MLSFVIMNAVAQYTSLVYNKQVIKYVKPINNDNENISMYETN